VVEPLHQRARERVSDDDEKVDPLSANQAPEGDGVEVAVRDDGAGIDPAHHERVFRPYFTTKKQGTGLGLFVTRKIVGEHGGSVAFESEPGKGTTFRVRLPATGDGDGRPVS